MTQAQWCCSEKVGTMGSRTLEAKKISMAAKIKRSGAAGFPQSSRASRTLTSVPYLSENVCCLSWRPNGAEATRSDTDSIQSPLDKSPPLQSMSPRLIRRWYRFRCHVMVIRVHGGVCVMVRIENTRRRYSNTGLDSNLVCLLAFLFLCLNFLSSTFALHS